MGNKTNRSKMAFWIGSCFFTASLSWLIANISRLVYGQIAPFEAFIPVTLLLVGVMLVLLFHDAV